MLIIFDNQKIFKTYNIYGKTPIIQIVFALYFLYLSMFYTLYSKNHISLNTP
jgi:hypothetical protein